jgi:hypothetical protein
MTDTRRALSVVLPAPRGATAARVAGDADALRQAWRRAAVRGWRHAADWWVPEVDGLVEALVTVGDALAACARLGRARAEAGVGLPEALDDLCALYLQLPAGGPPPGMVRALTESWAETVVAAASRAATCEDALSGLATAAYLRTRLAEAYRAAEHAGRNVADDHILLVVDLSGDPVPVRLDGPPAAGWDGMLLRLSLGDRLRAVFPGGETLAAVGGATVIGLLPRGPQVQHGVERLRAELLAEDGLPKCRVWLEALPRTLPAAHDTVEYLAG